jgi:hypothetical protein
LSVSAGPTRQHQYSPEEGTQMTTTLAAASAKIDTTPTLY